MGGNTISFSSDSFLMSSLNTHFAELEGDPGLLDIMSNVFTYLPLSSIRNIRLLRISNGKSNIHCTLEEVAEKQTPPYWALSYTWGNPILEASTVPEAQREKIIYCNQAPLRVTENLFECLNQLRESGWQGYTWIDAICINQADLDERNAQVHLMADTYTNADGVYVWLGKADANTEEAMSLINTFAQHVHTVGQSGKMDQAKNLVFNDPAFYALTDPPITPFTMEKWAIIDSLLTRNYFGRLWVLQEFLMAKNILIACGKHSMSFFSLWPFCQFLLVSSWSHSFVHVRTPASVEYNQSYLSCRQASAIGFINLMTIFENSCKLGVLEDSERQSQSSTIDGATSPEERLVSFLSLLLRKSKTLAATEPKDYVIAPLSLASRFLPYGQEWAVESGDWISADYKQDIREIFTKVSILQLEKLPLLSCLGSVENPASDMDYPSWVHNYLLPTTTWPLSIREYNSTATGHWEYVDDRGKNLMSIHLIFSQVNLRCKKGLSISC